MGHLIPAVFLHTNKILRFGLINLIIVAALGVIMRIKIGFEFPYLQQKNLLLAHSHFAITGWVTHVLYVYLQDFLKSKNPNCNRLSLHIFLNYFFSLGLLITFFVQGYQITSILFLVATLMNSYVFAWKFYLETKPYKGQHPSVKWFIAGLFFQFLSSFGSIYLTWMMFSGHFNQSWYLSSIYFFLHFQYSGWFFFTIMGLFTHSMYENPEYKENPQVFTLFFIAAIPAFLLSVLWANLSWPLFIIAIIAVSIQMLGLKIFLKNIRTHIDFIQKKWTNHVKLLLFLSFISIVLKLILQTISVIPSVSQVAFGHRSIVIAYLHLVLLGFTTLFLLGYGYQKKKFHITKNSWWIICLLCFAVFANEAALMFQGVAGLLFIIIPYMPGVLLVISCLLFLSILLLFIDVIRAKSDFL